LYKEKTDVSEENQLNNNIYVYPNPASEYIEINFERCPTSVRCRTSEKIVIYNVLGECVKSYPTPALPASEEGVRRLDVSDLPVGFYFLRYGNYVKAFVKE
jgi:hypothetical protein